MKYLILLLCLLNLAACGQQDNLLNYENSYIGDNSAVSHILSLLPTNLCVDTFSLQTQNEPFELSVNYTNQLSTEEDLRYSAELLFALIPNVELIHFTLDDESKTYNRSDYTEEQLQQILKNKLAD